MNKHSLHPPYSLIFVIGQGLSDSIYIGAPRFYAYVNSKKILIEMIIKQKIYSVLARDLLLKVREECGVICSKNTAMPNMFITSHYHFIIWNVLNLRDSKEFLVLLTTMFRKHMNI